MKFNVPTLNKWVIYYDSLVGEAINHPDFEQRQIVQTNKVLKLDKKVGMALCVKGEVWQLGVPGQLSYYVDPKTKKFY